MLAAVRVGARAAGGFGGFGACTVTALLVASAVAVLGFEARSAGAVAGGFAGAAAVGFEARSAGAVPGEATIAGPTAAADAGTGGRAPAL
jgi:hypothetical protein